MITFEEMREKYLQKLQSQQEFDRRMNQLRHAQNRLVQPIRVKSDALNSRRHEIGRLLAELNIELGNINRERETLREEARHIGTIFYGLKKELIRMNPKAVPPTARGGDSMKPPIPERIRLLEDTNMQLIEKINRMKAQVRHNQGLIEKLRKREDKQDVQALIDEVQAERLRRSEQSDRDKQRSREQKAARYRASIDKRIEDCLRMNGKIE